MTSNIPNNGPQKPRQVPSPLDDVAFNTRITQELRQTSTEDIFKMLTTKQHPLIDGLDQFMSIKVRELALSVLDGRSWLGQLSPTQKDDLVGAKLELSIEKGRYLKKIVGDS